VLVALPLLLTYAIIPALGWPLDVGVSMMTEIRGISNAKAKRELGFAPHYPTYRKGFRDGLADRRPAGVSERGRA